MMVNCSCVTFQWLVSYSSSSRIHYMGIFIGSFYESPHNSCWYCCFYMNNFHIWFSIDLVSHFNDWCHIQVVAGYIPYESSFDLFYEILHTSCGYFCFYMHNLMYDVQLLYCHISATWIWHQSLYLIAWCRLMNRPECWKKWMRLWTRSWRHSNGFTNRISQRGHWNP
jgi:hypothetical protein